MVTFNIVQSLKGDVLQMTATYGADFSEHQGKINANQFKDKIQFGIIRVQAGYTHEDIRHKDYEQQFLNAKIPFVSYAYACYVSVSDAIAEANSFVSRLNKNVPKNKLRTAVDVEEIDVRNHADFVPATQAFIYTVKKAGYDCGIYSTVNYFTNQGLGNVKADFRWVAYPPVADEDNGQPHNRPNIPFDIWQFSWKGRLPGVPDNVVDLDLCRDSSFLNYLTAGAKVSLAVKSSQTVVTSSSGILKQGNSGQAVLDLQKKLSSVYYYPDKGAKNNGCDGIYGPKTADAVKRFQIMHGCTADGIYGPQTAATLNKAIASQKQAVSSRPVHTVVSGDTLWDIAQKNKTTVQNLKNINHLTGDTIYPGQKLYLK